MKRGRERMKEDAPRRRMCIKFWRGDQYWYLTSQGQLISQNTASNIQGGGKPPHRSRMVRNMIVDIVAREVSAATQRVPNYEVNPSNGDQDSIDAAKLAEKVARYGYDKWDILDATERVVEFAVVADEGFAWPYWDTSVPPYIPDPETGKVIGQGEIKIAVFGPNQVYWEPGQSFDVSRWHCVERTMTPQSVLELEGFIGDKVTPDATNEDTGTSKAKLVMVTDHLERPSPSSPQGRWLTIAGGKQILPERPYPCMDGSGKVLDEPVIHKLAYMLDADSDRDMGLVRHLLDSQRTLNNMANKQTEWITHAIVPQVIVQNGEFKQRLTDEPGAVYHATGTGEVKFREVGNLPPELGEIKGEALVDMQRISAQNDIPSGVTASGAIQSILESDQSRRAPFINRLAKFHSRLMRHCLYLVQRHYTEPRLIEIRGTWGPESISGFLGAQLSDQANVTVLPGDLAPRSRAQTEQRIMTYAQLGWVSPEQAMAAIDGGTAETLIDSYERKIGRAYDIIGKIKTGTLFEVPMRPVFPGEDAGYQLDEYGQPLTDQTGNPIPVTEVPGWMPRPFDDPEVQKTVFEDWMQTGDFDNLGDEDKQAAMAYYSALLSLEAQNAQRAQELQTQQAEQMGMQNAAKDQIPKPSPSLPALPSQNGQQ